MATKTVKNPRSASRARRVPIGAWFLAALLLLVAGFLLVVELSRPHVGGDPLRMDQLMTALDEDRVSDARILDADVIVVGSYERPDGTRADYNTPFTRDPGARVRMTERLTNAGVPVAVEQQVAKAVVYPALQLVMPALIIVLVFAYFIVSRTLGTGLFNLSSGARKIEAESASVSFGDVAGQDRAVAELREASEFLIAPERFAAVGAKPPKGILLYGPPGCGKTLMARALAGETGATFLSISGSHFVELYQGVGASRVRDLFERAREEAPAIVFIDEVDAVARRRSVGDAPAADATEQEQALNQLLSDMDGFGTSEGIIVIGATNRPDTLDPALLRPGRFDRSIGLEPPDQTGRKAILAVHARGRPLAAEVDLDLLAERAVGTTGADLASVVNEASLLTARSGRQMITQADLEAALEQVLETPERQRRLSLREQTVGRRALADERASFADVAGAEEALEELREIKEYLGDPERFRALGARIPRGYLLVGPPGCGKTLLARAVAGETHAAFIAVSAPEFVYRLQGEGAARVRNLFAEARSLAPAIVFIDEIDSVGATRGVGGDDGERQLALNQLLIELDGLTQRESVVVMAATNRLDILDSALVRPGRFDRQVLIELPDLAARRSILGLHSHDKRLAPDVDLDALAQLTRGMSGADLENVLNEAGLLAARRGDGEIALAHVEEALDRAGRGVGGARAMAEEDRRVVAYHEAGHGLVATTLPGGKLLHKLSIMPRGRSLGGTWLTEAGDRQTHSRSVLIEQMATLMGGRASEELVLGEATDSAAGDLVAVTAMAREMVTALGMSDRLGALNLNGAAGDGSPHSDETAHLIDKEVRALVDEAHRMARRVLEERRDTLERIATALMERETLTAAQVEELAGSPAGTLPPPEPAARH